MRSAEDLRRRWLDLVPRMMTRPDMWTNQGPAFDVMARTLLADLCFLDERDADQQAVGEVLRGYGKLGVAGPFIAVFGAERTCVPEVASVYAEQFHRLGYLDVGRVVDRAEWDVLTGGLRDRFDGRDVPRSEVIAEFGQPSLIVANRVLWLRQPDQLSEDQQAIASQLRAVERADPSQHLKPPTGNGSH